MVFGSVMHFTERLGEEARVAIFIPIFFAVFIVGVIGVAQIRDIRAERKRRGLGIFDIMVDPDDFSCIYLPRFGRMLVWFISTVVTAVSFRAF